MSVHDRIGDIKEVKRYKMFNWNFFNSEKPSSKVADEEEPNPPTRREMMQYVSNKENLTRGEIISYLKNKQSIVGGARAMNVQLPHNLRRRTEDWDLITSSSDRARKVADRLEDMLDEIFGSDMFYVEAMRLTFTQGQGEKMVYRVISRADNEEIADIHGPSDSDLPPGIVRAGVKYEALKSLRDKAIAVLKDPNKKHRWRKTKADLKRMNEAIRRRGGE